MADPNKIEPQTTPVFGVPVAPQPAATPASVAAPAAPTPPRERGFLNHALGFLGDFLMSRLRMGTPYRDARQNEKLNYARLQDAQDPSGAFANVGNIDAGLAAKLQEQSADNRRADITQQGVIESRESRIAAQKENVRRDVKNRAANYFNYLASDPSNIEERYANGRALWSNSAVVKADPDLQAELNDLYPPEFDSARVASSIGASVPVATQWAQRLTKERNDANEKRYGVVENGRNARFVAGEEGKNKRTAAVVEGANKRTAMTVEGANKRNERRIQTRPAPAEKPVRSLPTPKTMQEVNALPSGQVFIDPHGVKRRKK